MNRRRALCSLSSGVLFFVAGCGASGSPDPAGPNPGTEVRDRRSSAPVRIADFWTEADDDGRLVVVVVASNETDSRRRATVTARVRAGDRRETGRVAVDLPAGRTVHASIALDLAAEAFHDDGSIDLAIE